MVAYTNSKEGGRYSTVLTSYCLHAILKKKRKKLQRSVTNPLYRRIIGKAYGMVACYFMDENEILSLYSGILANGVFALMKATAADEKGFVSKQVGGDSSIR